MHIKSGATWDDLLHAVKGFMQFKDPYLQDPWIQPAANIMTALLRILIDRDGVTCFSIMAHELCENRILDLLVTTDHWAIADFYDRPPGERLSIWASIESYLCGVSAVFLADWRRLVVIGEMYPYTLLGILGIEPVSSREILDMIARASWFAEMFAAETGCTEV